MRWYVYGLTEADSEEFEVATGLNREPVRVLGVGRVRLLASRAPDDIEDLVTAQPDDVLAAILEHDDVLLELAATRTVVPARFGTLLADDTAVDGLLADPDGVLAAQVDRLAGAAEWVVSVSVDPEVAGDEDTVGDDLPPGHAFFARRRAATAVRTHTRERAAVLAQHLDTDLRRFARDFAPLELRGPDMVARGAYLVADVDVSRMGEVIDAAGDAAVVKLRGPLPAYRFAQVEA